jgi:hypothetical protein
MKTRLMLLATLASVVLTVIGCTPGAQNDEVCMKCKLTSPVAIGGGNSALWPGEQQMCGTPAEIDAFEAGYYNDVTAWKQSWTGPWASGANNYTASCDRY